MKYIRAFLEQDSNVLHQSLKHLQSTLVCTIDFNVVMYMYYYALVKFKWVYCLSVDMCHTKEYPA